ncbi:hypothetical protein PIN31115_03648 [Pandoraea iniqua]|uniref:Uncharacterized protein n=1 Tax=Pandoraea iniqua TaxID=2508288 RepID=A0A5E4X519_9BURK|nr:hypothetical protein PIN31115_03648 [Pandoraea iniqua]
MEEAAPSRNRLTRIYTHKSSAVLISYLVMAGIFAYMSIRGIRSPFNVMWS